MKYTREELNYCVGMKCIRKSSNKEHTIDAIRNNIDINFIGIYDYEFWISLDSIVSIPEWDKLREKRLIQLILLQSRNK